MAGRRSDRTRRRLAAGVGSVLIIGAFLGAFQLHRHARYMLGTWDGPIVPQSSQFCPPHPLHVLLQGSQGEENRVVLGRIARSRAELDVPYWARGANLDLRIRCQRLDLGGEAIVHVNGGQAEARPLRAGAYPWSVIRVVVPEAEASRGPLRMTMAFRGGRRPPGYLPADFGAIIEAVLVSPAGGSPMRLPLGRDWLALAACALAALALALALGATGRSRALIVAAGGLFPALLVALAPQESLTLLPWAWTLPAAMGGAAGGLRWLYARQPRAALWLATAALTLGVSGFILEGGLRALAHVRSAPRPRPSLPLLMENPRGTGSYRLRPNLRLTTRVPGARVVIRTNSLGMRWREVTRQCPPGHQRVAFLGDSFTFGCWADRWEHSFVGVADKSLSGEGWEALNFGVGGYGTGDEELLLHEEVLSFGPQAVICVVFNGNDFRDTFLGVHKEHLADGTAVLDRDLVARRVPAAYLVDDWVRAWPTPEHTPLRQLRHCATFRLIAPWFGWENLSLEFASSNDFLQYSFWSRRPYPPVAEEAVATTLSTLDRMASLLARRSILFGIVALPTREQVYAREPIGRNFDITLPQERLRSFAEQAGIPYLDMLPPLRTYVQATNENLYVAGDTHFNNRGHALVGKAIAEWFRRDFVQHP